MKDLASGGAAAPLSRYAPFRRAGDIVYFSGIIAADPATMRVIKGYADLPPAARKIAGEIGEMSSDLKDGPIAAQSWWVQQSASHGRSGWRLAERRRQAHAILPQPPRLSDL